MKVLLVSTNKEKVNMPAFPLGLNSVAAATAASGHTVRVLDFMVEDDPETALGAAVREFAPDAIGIGIRNIDAQSMQKPEFYLDDVKDVVGACKSLNRAPVIFGGAGYSIYPRSALEYCSADYGIVGEGEVVFPRLLDRIERGARADDVQGVVVPGYGISPRQVEKNLDTLPLPGYETWSGMEDKDEIWLPVQSRRGCPLNCSYCSTSAIEGRMVRRRSPGRVMAALRKGVEAGFSKFFFTDNTFNLPGAYAAKICREIIRRGLDIRWRCIFYPWKTKSELVSLMAEAGCVEVSLGFESGDPGILKNMNKKFTLDDVRGAARLLDDHGIRRTGFLLLGGPGETRDTVLRSVAFADSLNLNLLKFTPGIRIYPDTALARMAVQEGMAAPEDDFLTPCFYMARGLEDWLPEQVQSLVASRPDWIM